MAVAGPATNFSLALIAVALLKLGILGGVFEQNPESIEIWRLAVSRSPVGEGAVVFLSLLFFENLLLGVWNMLPIPPMDGFSAILLFLPAGRVTTFFELRGRLGMFYPLALLLLSGVFWSFFSPLLWSLIGFFFA
jgi:Zn-dependent protease